MTAVDRWFIRIISKTYTEGLESHFASRVTVTFSTRFSIRDRIVTLAANLVRYCLLCIELLRTGLHRPVKQHYGIIFFDRFEEPLPMRAQLLKHMLGDRQFTGISSKDKIRSVPNWQAVFRMMLQLPAILVAAAFQPWSPLILHYVRIVRFCLLTLSYVTENTDKSIYLFSHRPEVGFIAGFLKECGVRVTQVAATVPLTLSGFVPIGDSFKAATAYQYDEFQHYPHVRENCPTCELWAPEFFPVYAEHYRGLHVNEHHNIVGVYTDGFWLRAKLDILASDVIQSAIQCENELLEAMLAWLEESQPNTKLMIFPHPIERRHLHLTGEHQFTHLVQHPRVEIDLSEATDSRLQFDRIGLGVVVTSSIGFERVHIGFRTLFYTLPWIPNTKFPNREIESRYNQIFVDERQTLLEMVEKVRRMNHREFMDHYFGQEFFQRYSETE